MVLEPESSGQERRRPDEAEEHAACSPAMLQPAAPAVVVAVVRHFPAVERAVDVLLRHFLYHWNRATQPYLDSGRVPGVETSLEKE